MKIYNTLTRSVEEFVPNNPNEVKMYTCGPTVYHYAHIGNLRTYISEDILEKTLNYLGFNVKRCMNITDVGHLSSDSDSGEDKMLKGAKREHKTVLEIASMYTQAFYDDFKEKLENAGLICSGTSPDGNLVEIIELKDHPYFIAGQFHPEFQSRPDRPSPLFSNLIKATKKLK